jgi:hypothetical protein
MNNQGIRLAEDTPLSIPAGSEYEIEVELFRTGCFKHPKYGVVYIDKNYLNKLIENHQKRFYKTPVSFDADHDPTKFGALAWLKESSDCLSIKKKKYTDASGTQRTCLVLVGKLLLNSLGYSFIKEKRYRLFSIEIKPNFISQEMVLVDEELNGVKQQVFKTVDNIGPVIVSGAFTNRPFILDLDPMRLSEPTDSGLQSFSEEEEVLDFSTIESPVDDLGFMLFSMNDKEEEDMPKDKDPKKPNPFEQKDSDPKDKDPKDKEEEYADGEMKDEEEEEEDMEGMDCEDPKDPKKPPFAPYDKSKDSPPSGKEKDKKKEKQMKMNELMGKLSGKSLSDQVALLEGYSMSFSDTDEDADQTEAIMFNTILESKKAQVQSEKDRADALHQKRLSDKLRADAEAKAAEAAILVENAKQIGYEQKVQIFCDALRKDNHFESVVKVVDATLSSIVPSSRDLKFSTHDGKDAADFDLFGFVKNVLDALPADARLDLSEASAGVETIVTPDNQVPVVPVNDEKHPAHVVAFYERYSEFLKDTFAFSSVDELAAHEDLVSRIDPATGDYKIDNKSVSE